MGELPEFCHGIMSRPQHVLSDFVENASGFRVLGVQGLNALGFEGFRA